MTRARKSLWVVLFLVLAGHSGARRLSAQAPTLPSASHDPGSVRSTLGAIPGSGVNPFGSSPGTDPLFLGGRPGPSFPRVPSSITMPGGVVVPPAPAIVVPIRKPITDVPLFGPLELPALAEQEGPPDGLTLDAAIDLLLRNNLRLKALSMQISAARADVLTAGLRANPILFADSQLVPYGRYNKDHSGGPQQYDVNVTHPIDYSGKRLARKAAAEDRVNVEEALFQEAVRIQIDNLYTAFVDVLSARETARYARASEVGLKRLLDINEFLFRTSNVTSVDVNRARALLDKAHLGVFDADERLRRTKRILGALLNLPPASAESLEVRGSIADLGPAPPGTDQLVRIALTSRPDLAAQRLGITRAIADARVARADRFGNAYLLYEPYTFQDNSPTGLKSATSWALGLTMPVPVYNRNQGGVARARLNVEQTRIETAGLEQRIITEVRNAERQYQITRDLLGRIERDLLNASQQSREDTFRLFAAGTHNVTAVEANVAQKDYNESVRSYRDVLIRHRRSMLALNTAVGRRVLP
jgi:cobalt-zinc-cadmium efflux system outer membrane protein